jgi:hypothetical protein
LTGFVGVEGVFRLRVEVGLKLKRIKSLASTNPPKSTPMPLGRVLTKHVALCRWVDVCYPKRQGGFGVKKYRDKWFWKLQTKNLNGRIWLVSLTLLG